MGFLTGSVGSCDEFAGEGVGRGEVFVRRSKLQVEREGTCRRNGRMRRGNGRARAGGMEGCGEETGGTRREGEFGMRNGGIPQWWERGRSSSGQGVRVVAGRGEKGLSE